MGRLAQRRGAEWRGGYESQSRYLFTALLRTFITISFSHPILPLQSLFTIPFKVPPIMVATKQLSWLLWALSLVTAPVAARILKREEDFTQDQIVKGDALAALASLAYNESIPVASAKMRRTFGGSCNLSNVKVRQEWRTLSVNQRKNYIAAVKCLRTKPSLLAPGVAPGSKSLFDDFVVIHFQQTIFIHLTVSRPSAPFL